MIKNQKAHRLTKPSLVKSSSYTFAERHGNILLHDEESWIANEWERTQEVWKRIRRKFWQTTLLYTGRGFSCVLGKRYRCKISQRRRTRIGQPKFWINTTDWIVCWTFFPMHRSECPSADVVMCKLAYFMTATLFILQIISCRAFSIDPSEIFFYFLFSLHCFKWSRSEQILSKGFQTLTSWPLRFFRVNITGIGSSNINLSNLV